VEDVREASAARVVCRARVPAASPFVADGEVPSFVALDVAAQAAALLLAAATPMAGGYLVGVRDARFAAGGFGAGDRLTATVDVAACNSPLLVVRATVTCGRREVFSGTLTLYRSAGPG
jgi:predicted hotdog family 3-hydroxylacyl-ACP dehydratase